MSTAPAKKRGRPARAHSDGLGQPEKPTFNIRPEILEKLEILDKVGELYAATFKEIQTRREEILDIFFPRVQVAEDRSERIPTLITTPEASLSLTSDGRFDFTITEVGEKIIRARQDAESKAVILDKTNVKPTVAKTVIVKGKLKKKAGAKVVTKKSKPAARTSSSNLRKPTKKNK